MPLSEQFEDLPGAHDTELVTINPDSFVGKFSSADFRFRSMGRYAQIVHGFRICMDCLNGAHSCCKADKCTCVCWEIRASKPSKPA
jgi:hypothetical protein